MIASRIFPFFISVLLLCTSIPLTAACFPTEKYFIRPGVDIQQDRPQGAGTNYRLFWDVPVPPRMIHSQHGDFIIDASGFYEIQRESNQILLGDLQEIEGEGLAIASSGDLLYVCTVEGRIYVYDLTQDPPLLVETVEDYSFAHMWFTDGMVVTYDAWPAWQNPSNTLT